MDEDVVDTAPGYRVRLVADQDCPNPRIDRDVFAGALTYPRDLRRWIAVAEPGPLEDSWRYLVDRRGEDFAARVVERYVRLAGGASEYDSPNEGPAALWYCLPDMARAAGFETPTVENCAAIVADERAEYRAWAEGDVWGYVVEAQLHWKRTTLTRGWVPEPATEMETWEEIDACWGFIGREYAEASAREALGTHSPATAGADT